MKCCLINSRNPNKYILLSVSYDQGQYSVKKYEVAKCETKHGMMLRSIFDVDLRERGAFCAVSLKVY